ITQLESSTAQLQKLLEERAHVSELQTINDIEKFEDEINQLVNYNFDEALSDNMYSLYKEVPLERAYNYANSVLTAYRDTRAKLLKKYKEKIFNINIHYLKSEYDNINKKMYKNKKIRKLIDNLSIELLQSREIKENEFEEDLKLISEFQKARESLQERNEDFINSFGHGWKGRNTDLFILGKQVKFVEDINLHNKSEEEKILIKNLINIIIKHPNEFKLIKE